MALYLATFRRPVHGNVAAGLEGLASRELMEGPAGRRRGHRRLEYSSPARTVLGHDVRIL